MSELGEYLHQLRGTMSLREASQRSNGRISHAAITQAEKGINSHGKPFTPSAETLKEFAKLYNVSVNKLMKLAGYIDQDNAESISDSQIVDEDGQFEVSSDFVSVYGDIHAGAATWADEDIIGRVPVTKELIMRYGRNNLFALRIKGDSMNQVLLNGYVAIFAKDCALENGDIVAVLIDGDDATIKRYKQTSAAVIFEPESTNPIHRPYFFPKSGPQDFKILGKYLYATTQLL